MMKRTWFLPIAAVAAVFAHGQASPISLTGFNVDGVADGFSTYGYDTADVQAHTSRTLDGIYVFFAQGVYAYDTSLGLPTGEFTSQYDGTTQFQLADFRQNNVLLLGTTGDPSLSTTGTLNFSKSSAYSSLSFLEDGFNGSHATNYSINFADGSTQSGSFTAADNFFNSGYAIAGFGRVDRNNDGAFSIDGSDPRMYQIDVSIATGNIGKAVTGVTFTNAETNYTGDNNVGIWGISGVQAAPEPMSMVMLGFGALALIRRRK